MPTWASLLNLINLTHVTHVLRSWHKLQNPIPMLSIQAISIDQRHDRQMNLYSHSASDFNMFNNTPYLTKSWYLPSLFVYCMCPCSCWFNNVTCVTQCTTNVIYPDYRIYKSANSLHLQAFFIANMNTSTCMFNNNICSTIDWHVLITHVKPTLDTCHQIWIVTDLVRCGKVQCTCTWCRVLVFWLIPVKNGISHHQSRLMPFLIMLNHVNWVLDSVCCDLLLAYMFTSMTSTYLVACLTYSLKVAHV